MIITYNSTLVKDKDFQNAIDEHFRDISEQIRSLQKAIANHRHDLDYGLSYLESLLQRLKVDENNGRDKAVQVVFHAGNENISTEKQLTKLFEGV